MNLWAGLLGLAVVAVAATADAAVLRGDDDPPVPTEAQARAALDMKFAQAQAGESGTDEGAHALPPRRSSAPAPRGRVSVSEAGWSSTRRMAMPGAIDEMIDPHGQQPTSNLGAPLPDVRGVIQAVGRRLESAAT